MSVSRRAAELIDVATSLLTAEDNASPVSRVSSSPPRVEREEAYLVQLEIARMRSERGEVRAGFKVGLTSVGMQTQLGVDEPDFGHLFDSMRIADGGGVDRRRLIRPRAEPELAIIVGAELGGEITTAEAVAAIAGVAVAIEVVDSRVRDWDITWTDTVADNGSSSRYVLGDVHPADGIESFRSRSASLSKNDELVAAAPLSEVMGDPLEALVWLVATLHRFGSRLRPGDVVLTGSPIKSVDLDAGDHVVAAIEGLGEVGLDVSGNPAKES